MTPYQKAVFEQFLACPETHRALEVISINDAKGLVPDILDRLSQKFKYQTMLDLSHVMITSDKSRVYPIINDVPVLLVPENIPIGSPRIDYDLTVPKYKEAYDEMDYYNDVCFQMMQVMNRSHLDEMFPNGWPTRDEMATFPQPENKWIDAIYDSQAQLDAYTALSPVKDKILLQIGGKGYHAVKFLLAGAEQAWLITPMLGEAWFAQKLAMLAGVQHKLVTVAGIAEELPFKSGLFHGVYAGGVVHHMVLNFAMPEIARILVDNGKFTAVDPWKAPLYSLGTKIFGKREEEVKCRPLEPGRMAKFYECFGKTEVIHHGTLFRYLLLALSKIGIEMKMATVMEIMRLDDRICDLLSSARKYGSSVCLIAEK